MFSIVYYLFIYFYYNLSGCLWDCKIACVFGCMFVSSEHVYSRVLDNNNSKQRLFILYFRSSRKRRVTENRISGYGRRPHTIDPPSPHPKTSLKKRRKRSEVVADRIEVPSYTTQQHFGDSSPGEKTSTTT